jgi:4-cresol dehydrogenase (hydroxylating)
MTQTEQQAFNLFVKLLGEDNVTTEPSILNDYEKNTFAAQHRVKGVIRPGNTAQVQECMKIADKYNVCIYPISTGLNVGYGSKVPTADGCVIMDLKRMNRIIDYSEKLAYVIVEPGVTQQQLYDYLQQKQSKLWMDVTGAFRDHSMIGNIVERGFGHTPYSDHFANVCGLEVVLPDSRCIHTGFGQFPEAKATHVYRWGVGPYVDGLFTQSNLGIITRLTLWLMPEPEYFLNFFFSVAKNEQLEEVINLLRPLRLDGTINSALHIGNDYKVLSSIQLYPWDKTDGKKPLPESVLDNFSKAWDFGAWNAAGALYGSRQSVSAAKKRIRKQLKGKVKKLRFLDDKALKLAEKFQKPYQWFTGINLTAMLKILKPVYGMTRGVPTDAMIASTYWRKKTEVPKNPDPNRDGCGLLWCAPVAPTEGKYAMEIWEIIETTLSKYEFEPSVSYTLITPRAMDCVIAISYDREVKNEDKKAKDCHDELLNKLTAKGYFPYRLGVQSMYMMSERDKDYDSFYKTIKEALDPKGILAPGRYDIAKTNNR